MKKTYSTPLTEVVKINIEQMICQSPTLGGEYQTGGTVLDKDDDYEGYDPNLF